MIKILTLIGIVAFADLPKNISQEVKGSAAVAEIGAAGLGERFVFNPTVNPLRKFADFNFFVSLIHDVPENVDSDISAGSDEAVFKRIFNLWQVWRYGITYKKSHPNRHFQSATLSEVFYKELDIAWLLKVRTRSNHFRNSEIGAGLGGSYILSDAYSTLSRIVGLSGQPKSVEQQRSTDPDGDCGIQRVVPHIIGGRLDRLCGSVHALLGDKIRYLPLAGFFFAGITGIGCGWAFDNFHRERKRRLIGWLAILVCLPLGAFGLILGLP